jgi:uncharacterized membrane protein HdeD (DUF308 family)
MIEKLVRNWWVLALRGLAGILFAIAAFFWPGLTLLILVSLFGAYALIDGIIALGAAISAMKHKEPWGHELLEGLAGIFAGVITLFWPGITAVALVYIIAAWALITGFVEVAAAIRLRKEIHGEWLLALSGILSIIMGVVLVVWPLAGALAFVWLMGGYALLFGILFLMLAFRLRSMGKKFTRLSPT